MCVESLGSEFVGVKRGWKLFYKYERHLYSLARGPYQWDRWNGHGMAFPAGQWVKSPGGPGFQAYVEKPDIGKLREHWTHAHRALRLVILRQVRRGTIEGMEGYSDGRAGYCAQEVFIPAPRKSRRRKAARRGD